MAVIPEWYRKSFQGLEGHHLDYFGEALLKRRRGDEFLLVIVTEDALYLAHPDGRIKSNYELADVASIGRDGGVDHLRLRNGKVLLLESNSALMHDTLARYVAEAPVQQSGVFPASYATHPGLPGTHLTTPTLSPGVDRGVVSNFHPEEIVREEPFKPAPPTFYYASDRICTMCDQGALGYKNARFYCVECDEKYCPRCWRDCHNPNTPEAAHPQRILRYACKRCANPASEANDVQLCDACCVDDGYPAGGIPVARPAPTHDAAHIPPPDYPLLTPVYADQQRAGAAHHPPAATHPHLPAAAPQQPRAPPGGAGDRKGYPEEAGDVIEVPGVFFSAGDDAFPPRFVSVLEAIDLARAHPEVAGFTYKDEGGPDLGCRRTIFFKTASGVRRHRGGPWTSYLRRNLVKGSGLEMSNAHGANFLPPSFNEPTSGATDVVSRALIVGCDYHGTQGKLKGAERILGSLRDFLRLKGFCREVRVLSESNPAAAPTRRNILSGLEWLVHTVLPGESLFFAFVGHGGDLSLAPMDHDTHGIISQADLEETVLNKLPAGSKLTIVADFCRGGSLLDLPHRLAVSDGGREVVQLHHRKVAGRINRIGHPLEVQGRILMVAGNRSSQVDRDVLGDVVTGVVAGLTRLKNATHFELLKHAEETLRDLHQGEPHAALEISSNLAFNADDVFHLCRMMRGEDRRDELLREMFSLADRDKDGLLGYADLRFLCDNLGTNLLPVAYANLCEWLGTGGLGLTLPQLKRVYREISTNRSIQEDYDALVRMKAAQKRELLAALEGTAAPPPPRAPASYLSPARRHPPHPDDAEPEEEPAAPAVVRQASEPTHHHSDPPQRASVSEPVHHSSAGDLPQRASKAPSVRNSAVSIKSDPDVLSAGDEQDPAAGSESNTPEGPASRPSSSVGNASKPAPGSPAAKKNTAIALDTDEVQLSASTVSLLPPGDSRAAGPHSPHDTESAKHSVPVSRQSSGAVAPGPASEPASESPPARKTALKKGKKPAKKAAKAPKKKAGSAPGSPEEAAE
ncbi:Metacaspase-2 [Diplonema papillatum]|nr:Metacaspase-2 [Diplonema papillatum]